MANNSEKLSMLSQQVFVSTCTVYFQVHHYKHEVNEIPSSLFGILITPSKPITQPCSLAHAGNYQVVSVSKPEVETALLPIH